MKKHVYIVVGLLVTLTLAVGCKKSVKGEQSRWKSANRTVDELAARYPGFKTALESQRASAKTIYDGAQAIEDEKQKISKLASANKLLTVGFVADLGKVDARIKALRAQIVEASGTADPAMKSKVKAARKQVKNTLSEVKKRLKKGASNAAEAATVARMIGSDLTSAEQLMARVVPRQPKADKSGKKGKKDKAKGKGKKAGAPIALPTKKAEPVAWTCEFCDHKNNGKAHKCSNCGAARGSKKK